MRSLLPALLIVCACRSQATPPPAPPVATRPAVTDVTAQDYPMPALPHARVTLTDAYGGTHLVDAEVAYTSEARTRGLMWRTSLDEGKGMLFIFPAEEQLTFWMKNTLIPLDMIFANKAQVIVGVVERATPRTLSPRGPETPATYVLEVPAGWAAKVGLRAGLSVRIDGTKGLVPQE